MQVIVPKYPKGKSKSPGASECCCSKAWLHNDVLINKLYLICCIKWFIFQGITVEEQDISR